MCPSSTCRAVLFVGDPYPKVVPVLGSSAQLVPSADSIASCLSSLEGCCSGRSCCKQHEHTGVCRPSSSSNPTHYVQTLALTQHRIVTMDDGHADRSKQPVPAILVMKPLSCEAALDQLEGLQELNGSRCSCCAKPTSGKTICRLCEFRVCDSCVPVLSRGCCRCEPCHPLVSLSLSFRPDRTLPTPLSHSHPLRPDRTHAHVHTPICLATRTYNPTGFARTRRQSLSL